MSSRRRRLWPLVRERSVPYEPVRRVLEASAAFAQTFGRGGLPMPPARRAPVVACMGARLHPERVKADLYHRLDQKPRLCQSLPAPRRCRAGRRGRREAVALPEAAPGLAGFPRASATIPGLVTANACPWRSCG